MGEEIKPCSRLGDALILSLMISDPNRRIGGNQRVRANGNAFLSATMIAPAPIKLLGPMLSLPLNDIAMTVEENVVADRQGRSI